MEAVLDTGGEITVVHEGLLPVFLRKPLGAVRLESAFGDTI